MFTEFLQRCHFTVITRSLNDRILRDFNVSSMELVVKYFKGGNFARRKRYPLIMFLNKNTLMHRAVEKRHT